MAGQWSEKNLKRLLEMWRRYNAAQSGQTDAE